MAKKPQDEREELKDAGDFGGVELASFEDTQFSPDASVEPGINADDPSFLTKTKELLHNQKLITIEIPSTERDKSAVTVTVNGVAFNIPRDKKVQVPEAVVHVLENAKYSTFSIKKREGGEGNELVEAVTQRHAYIVKGT